LSVDNNSTAINKRLIVNLSILNKVPIPHVSAVQHFYFNFSLAHVSGLDVNLKANKGITRISTCSQEEKKERKTKQNKVESYAASFNSKGKSKTDWSSGRFLISSNYKGKHRIL